MKELSIFLIAFSLLSINSSASHMMGGDITYECIGGNTYLMTMSFYRDCSGILAPQAATIMLSSQSCAHNQAYVLPLDTTMEVNPGCSNWSTTCNGGSVPGVELHVFRDTVTLPFNCYDWVISFDLCCRNAAISNLVDPSTQDGYIESTLDNLNFGCNSSPAFQEQPSYIICVDQPFCINNSAYEPDGDSLVYEMVDPLGAGAVPLAFMPPFSAVNPMPSSSGINFDPLTGNVCLTPTVLGAYVINFRVNEYRNGSLIGTTMRDMQIWVTNCDTSLAHSISGTVSDTTATPVNSGTVEVYEYDLNMGSMLLYGSQSVGVGGTFNFPNVPYGQYMVRATPDTVAYPNTAPTYHWNTFYWSYGNVLSAFCDSNFVADVQLVGYGDLVGNGFMSGYLGELGVRSSTGDPFPGVSILVVALASDELVAAATTDANGNWSVNGLPNGTYKVVVDIPGLSMISHHYVLISNGNEIHTDLNYLAEPIGIMVAPVSTSIVDNSLDEKVQIFPNPTDGALSINVDVLTMENVQVILMDMSGRSIKEWRIQKMNTRADLQLPDLSNGTYLIRLNTDQGSTTKQVNVLK